MTNTASSQFGWSASTLGQGSDGGSTVTFSASSSPSPSSDNMAILTATSAISQNISWVAGDTLSFWYQYIAIPNTQTTKPDTASATLNGVALISLTETQGWTLYSNLWSSSSVGLNSLVFSSVNAQNDKNTDDSIFRVSNVQVISPVPIPGSALLLGSGLLGLLGIGSRKKQY